MNTHTKFLRIGMRAAAGLAAALLLFTGCATSTTTRTSAPPLSYPARLTDWNGVDSVEFVKPFTLADYRHLQVTPLDSSAARLPPVDDNSYEPTVAAVTSADGVLLYQIERVLEDDITVSPEASPKPALIVKYRLSEIDPGSRAARYWVGFGAGSSWVRINGEVIDEASGETLVRFDQRRIAATGAFGGDYEKMLKSCFEEIGRDIGRVIRSF